MRKPNNFHHILVVLLTLLLVSVSFAGPRHTRGAEPGPDNPHKTKQVERELTAYESWLLVNSSPLPPIGIPGMYQFFLDAGIYVDYIDVYLYPDEEGLVWVTTRLAFKEEVAFQQPPLTFDSCSNR